MVFPSGARKYLLPIAAVALTGAYSPDALVTTESNATLRNIPSTAAPYVMRLGFAAPGDAGMPLIFKASTAACTLNSGNGDGGSQVKSLDNKCWVADFTGLQPTPLIWGAKGDGTTDDSLAFEAALEAMAGQILYQGNRSYYLGPARSGGLYFPPGTTLKGPFGRSGPLGLGHSTRSGPPRPEVTSQPYPSYPAIRIASTVGINLLNTATIDGVLMYRAGMTFPATNQSAFAGTPLNVAGDNVTIRNSLVMGFAQAIGSDGFSRGTIANMSFDNKANILIANSTDTWQISHIHAWPFASDSPTMNATNYLRNGPNFKIRNSNDWTMISHYVSVGYLHNFVFENNQGATCLDCDADNGDGAGIVGSAYGFEITGTLANSATTLIAPKAYGHYAGIYRSDTGGTNSLLKITGATVNGNTSHGIFLDGTNGITQLYNSEINANISGISLNNANSILDMDGNVMIGNGAPNPINAFNPTDNVFIGAMNRFGINSTTGVQAAGVNVFPKAVTISGATINLPPVGTYFAVTGGGSFGNLEGGWGGRQVTLIFTDGVTTVQTTNTGTATNKIQLKGGINYTPPARSAMTLLHSGNSQWLETARQ